MPATTHPPTLEALAEALTGAAPDLDGAARRVVIATYGLLARGEAITDADVAAAAGLPTGDAAGLLAEWPGVYRNADGAIVGFWGLARDPLDPEYRLQLAGYDRPVYAWCAWDTLFLPAVLGETIDIGAADGHTGAPISLTVSPQGPDRVVPAETVVSFVVPRGRFDADVVASFCHKVLFFANADNAAAWIAAHPDELFTLSVDDAFEVGRLVTTARYGDELPTRSR